MTIDTPASVIATRYTASGKFQAELELAILRHMEHHVARERERCAKIVESNAQIPECRGHILAIAEAIRASDKPFPPNY